MKNPDLESLLSFIRDPENIRKRCHTVFESVRQGKGRYIAFHEDAMIDAENLVLAEFQKNYPDGDVPYHSRLRHFEVGGVDRIQNLLQPLAEDEKLKTLLPLIMISVLLDAGAGDDWTFVEEGVSYNRSEGLAVASFHMFQEGLFSDDKKRPLQVSSQKLSHLTAKELEDGFQVSVRNPLVGIDGRLQILQNLGRLVSKYSQTLGQFLQGMVEECVDKESVEAKKIFAFVLREFSPLWPEGLLFEGQALGDVGQYEGLAQGEKASGLVPFHKLSQWLTYSILDCFLSCGYRVEGVEVLTGLPEYRNGGLFIDCGVLKIKDEQVFADPLHPYSEPIVEWRACTVCLLDLIAERICGRLGKSSQELPLIKVLQGGTWSAGRVIARKLREKGGSPIQLESRGTVF